MSSVFRNFHHVRLAICQKSTTVNIKIIYISYKPHLVPSHPQQRHTQTSGITPFTSNKYQSRGQNSATGRDSPTLSVMVTARERSATERALCMLFRGLSFPPTHEAIPLSNDQTSLSQLLPHFNSTRRSEILRYAHSGLNSELDTQTLLTSIFTTMIIQLRPIHRVHT